MFFKNKKSQKEFLINCALTFRLHIDLLTELFQYEEVFDVNTKEELYSALVSYNYSIHNAMVYLLDIDNYNQELAMNEFKKFYAKFLISLKTKNKVYIDYLNELNNHKFLEIIEKDSGTYNDDEYFSIVKYQLKYALSIREISRIISRSHSGYVYRAKKVLQDYPELLESYNRLIEFNNENYKQNINEGRKK